MTPDARAELHALCFETPRPWSAAEFASMLSLPHVFVTDMPGGFAIGQVVAGEAEVLTLAVAPEHRRQGIGRALLRNLEDEAVRRGGTEIFLEVSAENGVARALYTAAGFRPAGRRKGYYRAADGRRIDALILGKPLPPG